MTQMQENDRDEKRQNTISWMTIANCVHHEMYPILANAIKSTINSQYTDVNINLYDLDDKSINKLISNLKSKKLGVEERTYLYKLCQRAMNFIPITNDNRKDRFVDDNIDEKDFSVEYKGLNAKLLQDIFDVHRP
eukprot:309243_1